MADAQAGTGKDRAVAEIPGVGVRVQQARVGEATLEHERAGTAAGRRRDLDVHRRRDVVDVETHRRVVVRRP